MIDESLLLRKLNALGLELCVLTRAASQHVFRHFSERTETNNRLQLGLFTNICKICSRNKGTSAELLR